MRTYQLWVWYKGVGIEGRELLKTTHDENDPRMGEAIDSFWEDQLPPRCERVFTLSEVES